MGLRARKGMDRHRKYIFPYHPLHILSLSCEGVALMNARGSSLFFVLVFITFVGHINPSSLLTFHSQTHTNATQRPDKRS